jgi:hypothetical protein
MDDGLGAALPTTIEDGARHEQTDSCWDAAEVAQMTVLGRPPARRVVEAPCPTILDASALSGAVCGQSGNVRKSEEAASGLCLPIVADQQIETPWNAD